MLFFIFLSDGCQCDNPICQFFSNWLPTNIYQIANIYTALFWIFYKHSTRLVARKSYLYNPTFWGLCSILIQTIYSWTTILYEHKYDPLTQQERFTLYLYKRYSFPIGFFRHQYDVFEQSTYVMVFERGWLATAHPVGTGWNSGGFPLPYYLSDGL